MNYNVTIKGFSSKVYYNTTIEEILNEIRIFSNINDIMSIDKLSWQLVTQKWVGILVNVIL